MNDDHNEHYDPEAIHVNLASSTGAHCVGDATFFRLIVRQGDFSEPRESADREALDLLGSIPNAFPEEEEEPATIRVGRGWRLIPPQHALDWSVLEATPQRLRDALKRAQHLLWQHAGTWSVSAVEIDRVEAELDALYSFLLTAESAGAAVNINYVA